MTILNNGWLAGLCRSCSYREFRLQISRFRDPMQQRQTVRSDSSRIAISFSPFSPILGLWGSPTVTVLTHSTSLESWGIAELEKQRFLAPIIHPIQHRPRL